MSTPSKPRGDVDVDGSVTSPIIENPYGAVPPTYAAFSSSNLSSTTATAAARRSTILVHQKSPLLLATPPQVTRALAYSHPFLLPLNKLAGLLSWTTGDAWESFLLLVVFWATVQYGDFLVRFAGPIVVVVGIIAGMYGRRYSPLSSSGWGEHPSWASSSSSKASKKSNAAESSAAGGASGKKSDHQRHTSESTNTRHQKTLDEIVDTVKVFTTRCNILLEPLLLMTDFLSTQRTATSATTRPALTAMFVRILAVTPIWVILTLPPLRIITTKRVIMVFGTLVLSWHSRICKVSRTLLWRSATVRRIARWVTGLEFEGPKKPAKEKEKDVVDGKLAAKSNGTKKSQSTSALTTLLQRSRSGFSAKETGVRFTFILYENQRRWVGLGWTNNLFAYERSAWTDEHNNAVPPRDEFELPEVEDGHAKWRWVKGSKWRVDGVPDIQDEHDYDSEAGKNGWIYYDNKWNNGRRGADGWGRWTRRRKWYRDAELVEVNPEVDELSGSSTPAEPTVSPPPPELPARPAPPRHDVTITEPKALLSSSVQSGSSDPGHSQTSNEHEKDNEETDTASVLSTSSKSARGFKWPGFGINPYAHSHSNPPSIRSSRKVTDGSKRSRRTSDSVNSSHENDAGSLTPALELEIQGSRKEQASWGFGDEVSMGLE